jgi:hypothetical protein
MPYIISQSPFHTKFVFVVYLTTQLVAQITVNSLLTFKELIANKNKRLNESMQIPLRSTFIFPAIFFVRFQSVFLLSF